MFEEYEYNLEQEIEDCQKMIYTIELEICVLYNDEKDAIYREEKELELKEYQFQLKCFERDHPEYFV